MDAPTLNQPVAGSIKTVPAKKPFPWVLIAIVLGALVAISIGLICLVSGKGRFSRNKRRESATRMDLLHPSDARPPKFSSRSDETKISGRAQEGRSLNFGVIATRELCGADCEGRNVAGVFLDSAPCAVVLGGRTPTIESNGGLFPVPIAEAMPNGFRKTPEPPKGYLIAVLVLWNRASAKSPEHASYGTIAVPSTGVSEFDESVASWLAREIGFEWLAGFSPSDHRRVPLALVFTSYGDTTGVSDAVSWRRFLELPALGIKPGNERFTGNSIVVAPLSNVVNFVDHKKSLPSMLRFSIVAP